MRRLYTWIAAVCLACGVFIGCRPAGGLLFYLDPYELEVLSGKGLDQASIRQRIPAELDPGIEVSALQADRRDSLAHFEDTVARYRPRWVYLSAAHPFAAAEICSLYPQILFFTETRRQDAPDNLVAVAYDRLAASYRAGKAIAALLQDEGFLEQIAASASAANQPRVGILAAVSTQQVESEISAFVEGFSQSGDAQRIVRKTVGNVTDRVKARRLLDEMDEQDVAIVFLKTYVLSGFCLEYLSKNGGVAVVEEPISDQAYGETVLLMLEDDFRTALEGMVEAALAGGASPEGRATVRAETQLRWNAAYSDAVKRTVEGVIRQ